MRGMGELWMIRWTQWFYRVFWPLRRLLWYHCVCGHLILHFPLASEGRACTCSFLLCTCRFGAGWFHLRFVRKETLFPSFLYLSPSSFHLPHPLHFTNMPLCVFLSAADVDASLPWIPTVPPSEVTVTDITANSITVTFREAQVAEGFFRDRSAQFWISAVLPKTSAFRVGLGEDYITP